MKQNFDQCVMQYFIKETKKKSNTDIIGNKKDLQKLWKDAGRVNRALSSQQQAWLEIKFLAEGFNFSETLMRVCFKELNNNLFKKAVGPVGKITKDNDVLKSEVEEIVTVGSSTHIWKVGGCGQCWQT